METSASFEARSAPSSYPTTGIKQRMKESHGKGVGSSRQCWESCEVKVLVPPIACSRAASLSDACEGNDARSART